MLVRILVLFVLGLWCQTLVAAQQTVAPCPNPIEYENHNQINPPPLSLRFISGRAIAQDGVTVPYVCLGLFTERGHRSVASVVADEEGYFRFNNISPGLYRLVAKDRYGGLCTANVGIRVVRYPRGGILRGRRIVLHMIPPAIDVCSYSAYK